MRRRLVRFPSVGSTNDIVLEAAQAGAAPGLVVQAGEQLRGKGRRARDWRSPPGGLWMSVLLDPRAASVGQGLLPLAVGSAAAEALVGLGVPTRLRWPNDLMVGDAKLGGILVESRTQGERFTALAAGIGINVENAAPGPEATACHEHVPGVRVAAVRGAVLDALSRAERSLATGDAKWVCQAFMARAWGIDRALLLDGEPVTPREIALDGALIVERPGGRIDIARAGSLRPT